MDNQNDSLNARFYATVVNLLPATSILFLHNLNWIAGTIVIRSGRPVLLRRTTPIACIFFLLGTTNALLAAQLAQSGYAENTCKCLLIAIDEKDYKVCDVYVTLS